MVHLSDEVQGIEGQYTLSILTHVFMWTKFLSAYIYKMQSRSGVDNKCCLILLVPVILIHR